MKREVLDAPGCLCSPICIGVRQFVEEEATSLTLTLGGPAHVTLPLFSQLGNLPLAVALLKKALSGPPSLTCMDAVTKMAQFRSATVASLGGQNDNQHLRGIVGTVNELIRRLHATCDADEELRADAMALLSMIAVLNPAGCPEALFVDADPERRIPKGCTVGVRLFEDEGAFRRASDELEETALSRILDVQRMHDPAWL